MLKRYQHIVGGAFRFVDACVIGLAWLISYWIRFNVPIIEVTKGFPAFKTYASLLPVVICLWMVVFSALKVYRSRRMLRRTHEVQLLLKSHGIALLIFIALTYLFSEYRYSRAVMLYFGILGGLFLVIFRLLLRNGLREIRRKGYNLRHVIAVGHGPSLEHVLHRIEKFPELGLRITGVVTHSQAADVKVENTRILGHFENLSWIVDKEKPDELLIALPRNQSDELDSILRSISESTVDIRLIPDLHEYVTLGCEVEDFDGLPIVNINESPLEGWGAVLKRATDVVVATIALIILLPLLLLIGLLVKLTSKGPVFYSQERMGLDGRTFRMYKFRSMRQDAESSTGAVWATQGDQRKTGFGTLLRTTSLDELPQFWNVLCGDMSLVGPRPERPVFVKQFRQEIPHYMLRHKVKAGITGWAQVNGWRGNTSLDRRIEFDLYYIKNWSYLMDWKILFMTLWKGFVNKNAY